MYGTDFNRVWLLTNAIGKEEIFAFDPPAFIFNVGEECIWDRGDRESRGKHLLTLTLRKLISGV